MSDLGESSNAPMSKRCLDCGEVKPLDDFSYSPRGVHARNSYCKLCMRVRSKASYRRRQAAAGKSVREVRTVPVGARRCPDCGLTKPLSEFPRNRSEASGYAGYCKPCHNARGRESRERLHGGSREYHLRRRYGIGQVDVDRMLAQQNGRCAVCGKPDPEHVDHDHRTGRVRGLLCFNCNQALGNVRDNLLVIYGLATYLKASLIALRPSDERNFGPLELVYDSVRHTA